MTIVSNTGPLIALAKINRLDLLERLFGNVQIPPAVHRELMAIRASESQHMEDALKHFISVRTPSKMPPAVQIATSRLGSGEQEAIVLAFELQTSLLIDDRAGRLAAKRLGLSVTGVAGALIRAKEMGQVPAVRPLLEEIRERGYWLSDEVVEEATKLAGEKQ